MFLYSLRNISLPAFFFLSRGYHVTLYFLICSTPLFIVWKVDPAQEFHGCLGTVVTMAVAA